MFDFLQPKALGRVLFDLACKQLNLLEVDYFGLEYGDADDCKVFPVYVLVVRELALLGNTSRH